MQNWILVGLGGFIGALLRYYISGWVSKSFTSFPLGTLVVNLIGAFFLGLIMYSAEYYGVFTSEQRLFLTIGVLGSFTTMSTFSYESFKLLETGEYLLFLLNIIGTVGLTLTGVYIGKIIALSIGGIK
ncbi:MAG: fluoride efflux transporter CrcB [Candidatus Odinarchaeum yellowstonii]|jgi:CrcB protein|uniref:Fluoride-specific ion channel FluC n=1 Tax=Odinarchaeota yellowstonii (strain LCB_4) TaxID=1841599 RepID=A0AAF0IBL9_ODILC|nr:MAG: fluoride efflux transporter CrcB [Candidatus Odinarchaeum yellowstonii]